MATDGAPTADKPKRRGLQFSLRTLLAFVTVCAILCSWLAVNIRRAAREARRSVAYGRLCQMRFVLQNYEKEHGALPPLNLRDNQGNPILSWRGLILPSLYPDNESFKQVDLSKPWNNEHNRRAVDSIPLQNWIWFARDVEVEERPAATHILAYLGSTSMWDSTTGLPTAKIAEHPERPLLISVPESRIEPLQPGDITEDEVRKLVEDGLEVLFVLAGAWHGYGVVAIRDGKLAFDVWQDVLSQRNGGP